MRFTQKWFEITARDNFANFLAEYKGKDGLSFLEIGCFEGMGTRWLLENILTGNSKIDVIDTFEGSEEHIRDNIEIIGLEGFKENIVEYKDKVEIHKGFSQKILRNSFYPEKFDFIYVDGSHQACDALQDMCFSWDLLKKGGIMIMDDYAWNGFDDRHNACIAIDGFLSCFRDKYELLLKAYQVVIKKI
jgi:predicted O-methyltransferase YrrM